MTASAMLMRLNPSRTSRTRTGYMIPPQKPTGPSHALEHNNLEVSGHPESEKYSNVKPLHNHTVCRSHSGNLTT